ncbi:MAG TPA: alpha/beta hydrolase [Stackebrandtia sp.]|nr:alpha/beta hydrolase [Stackebrandtia sp.]
MACTMRKRTGCSISSRMFTDPYSHIWYHSQNWESKRREHPVNHQPPLGRLVEVDGRQLWTHISGDRGPTVVILPGGGTIGLDYLNLHDKVAETATSVLYDRAGTGFSDPAELPRGSAEVVEELRGLLRAAELPGPYVFIGHSLGGCYARDYAHRHPDEVAGLLLLDPAHEDLRKYMPAELTKRWDAFVAAADAAPELPAEVIEFYRAGLTENFDSWPSDIRDAIVDYHVGPVGLRTGMLESSNIKRLNEEMRAMGPLPRLPVIVMTSMGIDEFKRAVSTGIPEDLLLKELEGKRRLYDDLVAGVPTAENRLVPDAGHVTIYTVGYDLVCAAIDDLLAKV